MEDDLKLAELVLLELPRAQADVSGRSLIMVDRLMKKFGSDSAGRGRTESARIDTFLAIAKIGAQLLKDDFSPDEDWADAIRCARVWRSFLI